MHASDPSLRLLAESLPVAVCRFGRDGSIAWANPAHGELVGEPPAALAGRDVLEPVPEEERAGVREALAAAGPERPCVSVEHRVVRGDGERWVRRDSVAILDGSGAVAGFCSLARDVTRERGAAERLARQERLASVGTLAGGVAHELNNPLGAILLAAQSALRALDSGGSQDLARDALELIESEVLRSGDIVRTLLSFVREGPGRAPGRVEEAAANARRLTRKHAEGLGADLAVEVAPGLPATAASRGEIEQVLVTLILHAADSGAERIAVTAEPGDGGVRVAVSDDGAGELEDAVLAVLRDVLGRGSGTVRVEAAAGGGKEVVLELPAAP